MSCKRDGRYLNGCLFLCECLVRTNIADVDRKIYIVRLKNM